MQKKIVVAGATGLVGSAALRHFSSAPDCDVTALSRRHPNELHGASFVACDLTDAESCQAAGATFRGATHLVYAALYEEPSLIDGWRDDRQIRINSAMLRNLMAALEPAAPGLKHVALLQGAKAYGTHVRPMKVPAREDRSEMFEQPNFYWEQQNFLSDLQRGKDWHFSILRPPLIVGEAMGGAMDVIPALGVYAAIQREQGEPLHFPGGGPRIGQAVDVDLLARAIAWCGDAPSARNQAFNVTNGDVFTWENVWPAVADALGVPAGEARPLSLARASEDWSAQWDAVRARHKLTSPGLKDFVGLSFQYADYQMRYGLADPGPASFLSTVKINQAGFTEMMDTEIMLRKWFGQAREKRWLP